MTSGERKAAIDLINAIRATRNGMEMAAGIDAHRMNDDDLTFAMEQAMAVVGKLESALARCREANREAHRLMGREP